MFHLLSGSKQGSPERTVSPHDKCGGYALPICCNVVVKTDRLDTVQASTVVSERSKVRDNVIAMSVDHLGRAAIRAGGATRGPSGRQVVCSTFAVEEAKRLGMRVRMPLRGGKGVPAKDSSVAKELRPLPDLQYDNDFGLCAKTHPTELLAGVS
jgi:hypothetical protein